MSRLHSAWEPAQHELLLWTSSAGAQCVLVSVNHALALQLIQEGRVERYASDIDPLMVRELAQRWRLEYELALNSRAGGTAVLCPECGEDAPPAEPGPWHRRTCAACGHEWLDVSPGQS